MGEIVRLRILLVSLTLLASSCAASRVEHVAPDESRPHVTWEIREGGESGDDRFVCGSTEPARPCALAASTEQSASEATVRLFLHAAATDTSYLGLMAPPFLDRAAKDREISITVPRGSQPVLSMVTGRVSAKPGAYSFTIALDATESGARVPVRITQQIPVAVNAPSSSTTASFAMRRRLLARTGRRLPVQTLAVPFELRVDRPVRVGESDDVQAVVVAARPRRHGLATAVGVHDALDDLHQVAVFPRHEDRRVRFR